VSRVGGVGHNLPCTPQGRGCIQVLERWQIAANHLLGGTDDTLQSAFVIGSGSSVPDGDGGGEDGLDDARTGDWRCSCWYTGRRVEGKERSLEGNRCLWSWSQTHEIGRASCRERV